MQVFRDESHVGGERADAPRVSILLAVYNGAKYLSETMDSVLAQSMSNWELLVINDGSSDGSDALIRNYSDPRIRYFEQVNSGAASAILRGYNESTGEFIAFLDQDDIWLSDFLEMHLRRLEERKDLQATFSWFKLIDSSGRPLGLHSQRHHGKVTFEELLCDFTIGATSNVIMRRQAIELAGGIDCEFQRMYDLDLFLRISRITHGCIESIPSDLMLYRRHGSQMSSNYDALMEEWDRVFAKLRCIEPAVLKKQFPVAKSNAARYFARVAYEQMRYGVSLRLLGQGFMAAPVSFLLDLRNWVTLGAASCGMVLPRSIHRQLEKAAGFDRG